MTNMEIGAGSRPARRLGARLVQALITISLSGAAQAAPPAPGYLPGTSIERDLGYQVPPPPNNGSEQGRLDLAMVEMAQTHDPAAYQEAYEDAGAYDFDQLMPRFNAAAGTELSPASTPILAHVLKLVLGDTGNYAGLGKNAYPRNRPYVEDPRIVPCETDYLRTSDGYSYPSGHATNGYEVALVLAEVMPDRAAPLLERGIRYGSNRVVCGVHHPSDVEEGRALAIAIFAKLKASQAFQDDVNCAREEHERSIAGRTPDAPWTPRCARLSAQYTAEFAPKPSDDSKHPISK